MKEQEERLPAGFEKTCNAERFPRKYLADQVMMLSAES